MPSVVAGLQIAGSIALSFLIEWIVRKTLVRLTRKTETDLDDKILAAIRRPIVLTVIFIGCGWATVTLGLEGQPKYFAFGALQTLSILVWGRAALRVAPVLLGTVSKRARTHAILQPGTLPVFNMLATLGIGALVIYLGFVAWEVDLTAWLASAGIVGIAVGFAAQDTLSNLFSGVFILADAPYKLDDFIVLDGELRGRVTHIGIRSTRILTMDDVEITIPNSIIGSTMIVNETGGPSPKQRVSVTTSAAYGADADVVREVLMGCPVGIEGVCEEPAPMVRFSELGDSGLIFNVFVWIDDPGIRDLVRDILTTRIYKDMNEAGLEIPFCKQDVYIKEFPAQHSRAAGAKEPTAG